MSTTSKHILSEYGILSSFSVRQKISPDEFLNIYKKIESNSKDDKEIQRKFQLLMEEKSLEQIPGSIQPNAEQLKTEALYQRGMLISNLIKKDNLSKREIVTLINFMAKQLGVAVENQ